MDAQIAFILLQSGERTAVGEVCRKAGISEATFHVWRKKYAGLMPSELRRLKQLKGENGKLKQLVADLSLDENHTAGRPGKNALSPARRRQLVDEVQAVSGRSRSGKPAACCALKGDLDQPAGVQGRIVVLPEIVVEWLGHDPYPTIARNSPRSRIRMEYCPQRCCRPGNIPMPTPHLCQKRVDQTNL